MAAVHVPCSNNLNNYTLNKKIKCQTIWFITEIGELN